MDNLDLEIFFTPNFIDEKTGEKYSYTNNDEQESVTYNLIFTYSGPRAWGVRSNKSDKQASHRRVASLSGV